MAAEKILGFRIEVRGTDKQTAEMGKLTGQTNKMRQAIQALNKKEKTRKFKHLFIGLIH